MKLLKIIIIFFLIYFIRRFIQMYRVMKKIQEEKKLNPQAPPSSSHSDAIDADFKVVD